jgi:uncharacterized protein with HEPN domain
MGAERLEGVKELCCWLGSRSHSRMRNRLIHGYDTVDTSIV